MQFTNTTHFTTLPILPESPFPFTRLAGYGLDGTDGTDVSLFIYHQLNASAFEELQWLGLADGWNSTLITIAMT